MSDEVMTVPPGWSVRPLGEVLRRRVERATGDEPLLSVTQTRGVIPQEEVGRRDSSSTDKSGYWRVHPGDIVYNTMRMWQGASGVSKFFGIVGPAYTVCEPTSDVDPQFLALLFKRSEVINRFYRLSQGLVSDTWNLTFSTFSKISLPLPPVEEQRWIAEVLDYLDAVVAATRAVSKKIGAMRCGQLRDLLSSELDELAVAEASELTIRATERSESSRIKPLGDVITHIDAGNSPNVYDVPAGPGEWGVLKVSAIGRFGFRPEENKAVRDKSLHVAEYCVKDGDLLISRANTSELVGLACIVRNSPPNFMLSDKTLRLHVDKSLTSPEYVNLVLGTAEVHRQIETVATGTSGSMKNISQASIKRLMIPWVEREKKWIGSLKLMRPTLLNLRRWSDRQ